MTMTPEKQKGFDAADLPPADTENPYPTEPDAHTRRSFLRLLGNSEPTPPGQPETAYAAVDPSLLLAAAPDTVRLSEEHIPTERTRRWFLRTAGKTAIVAGYMVGVPIAAEKADEFIADRIWPSTKPKTHEIVLSAELTPEDMQHGTFVCGGYNVKNATKIANALKTSLGSNGRLFGIEYDNKGIQLDELVDTIAGEIEEKALSEISLYGHSMGGDVMLLAAMELLKRNPKLVIRNIFLDCTPTGLDTVRAKNKEMGALLANLNIRGGLVGRMAIELWNSPNRHTFFSPAMPYFNTRALLARMLVIKNEKFNSYASSNKLAADQISVIEAVDVPTIFSKLAEATQHQFKRLNVTLLRPKNGRQDALVNVDAAEEALRAAGSESGVNVSTILLEGDEIGHADPVASQAKYEQALNGLLSSQAESLRMLEEVRTELEKLEQTETARTLGTEQNGLGPNSGTR